MKKKPVFAGCGCALLLFSLTIILPGLAGFDAIGCILFGWISFIGRAVPRVTFEPAGVATFAVVLVLTALMGHGFSGWLWKSTDHKEPWRFRWTAAGLVLLILLFVSGMAITGIAHQVGWMVTSREPLLVSDGRVSTERTASATLWTYTKVQEDFRNHDRDGNDRLDYWRKDIAGLYTFKPPGRKEPLKLIEVYMAGADAAPAPESDIDTYTQRGPKVGYWFQAIRFPGEEEFLSPARFAACAYPDAYGASGNWTFIVSDRNVLYKKDLGREGGVEVFPLDPLKEGWEELK